MAIRTKYKKGGYSAATATEYVNPVKLSLNLNNSSRMGNQLGKLSPTRQPSSKKDSNLSKSSLKTK